MYLLEGDLSILSIFGDDFVEDHAEGVDVCWFFGFQDHVVLIDEVFDGSVYLFVCVACD